MNLSIPNAIQEALGHHQAGRLQQAEAIYRQILQLAPHQPDALHLLGLIAHQVGRNEIAVELIGKAVAIQPSAPMYYNLGIAFQAHGNSEGAVDSYRKALAIAPDYAEAHGNLGNALKDQGKLDEAAQHYRKAIALKPNFADPHSNLGIVLQAQGNLDGALEHHRKALAIRPDFAEAHVNLGNVLMEQRKLDAALEHYRQALVFNPQFAEAHGNLADGLKAQGKLDAAIEHYLQALALKPALAESHVNLGNALKDQGKLDAAVESYRKALALKPEFADAYSNLGNALHLQGKFDAAAENCLKAIALNPDLAEAHYNLGNTLKEQGNFDAAIASYHRALALKPNFAEARNNLGNGYNNLGEYDSEVECYRQALAIKPDFDVAHSNLLFCLNYDPVLSADEIFNEYRRWNTQHAVPLLDHVAPANERDAGRRLRIGYVSPDLRRHSVRHFIEPLLASHDHSQVEVFAYAQVAREDGFSARFKTYVDHWCNTVGLDDDALVARIRRDGIDILVDLAGHTIGNRLRVFARKAAPVQVSWLGYGYTTGLDAIDYLLADSHFAPSCSDPLFSEKLLRLPTWAAYRPAEDMGQPGPLPALRSGRITFGTLSRSVRINRRVIRSWAEILRRVPGASIEINSGDLRDASRHAGLLARFAEHGVAPERVLLGCDSPPWEVLRRIDISLDCFPHNSGTTLFESLYMGVPFVTLAERPSVGRIGSAILHGLGHSEWIAATEQEYIDKVVALAADTDYLSTLRGSLRGKMENSALMDEVGFTRSVEAAYRNIWQRWCDALPATSIGY